MLHHQELEGPVMQKFKFLCVQNGQQIPNSDNILNKNVVYKENFLR